MIISNACDMCVMMMMMRENMQFWGQSISSNEFHLHKKRLARHREPFLSKNYKIFLHLIYIICVGSMWLRFSLWNSLLDHLIIPLSWFSRKANLFEFQIHNKIYISPINSHLIPLRRLPSLPSFVSPFHLQWTQTFVSCTSLHFFFQFLI